MPLGKRSENKKIYLQVKYYCLWRSIDKPVAGCDEIEVTNPRTQQKVKQHGYAYEFVTGRLVKIEKYDTGKKYATRFFGFDVHIFDGTDTFVIKMPYQSQILRRFLRLAPNLNWEQPITLSIFKGKKNKGEAEDTGIWFQQNGATVKPYYTRENTHGCPPATQDPHTEEWDFKAQHQWLVQQLVNVIIPSVEIAAARQAPPVERHYEADEHEGDPREDDEPPKAWQASDDDVPF